MQERRKEGDGGARVHVSIGEVVADPEESLPGDVYLGGEDATVGDRPGGRMWWPPPTQRRRVCVTFQDVGTTYVSATDQEGTCRWAPPWGSLGERPVARAA